MRFINRLSHPLRHKLSNKAALLPLGLIIGLALLALSIKGSAAPGGLVASYNFNAGTGSTLSDISGTGNSGTISGASWNTGGKTGGALSFDGVNDYVNVPDSNSLDLTNGMTLEAWVRPNGVTGYRSVIFKQQPGHEVYAMYVSNGAGRPTGHVNIGGEKTALGSLALANNAWSHIATTYDGGSLKLYVNGTQVSSVPVSGNIPVTSLPLRFGGNAVWGEWYKGLMDDVRIYNRALSVSEIQSDMNTAVAPPATDTTPPTTPTNLTKTGQTENSISFSWSPSTDNVAVSSYGLYKDFFLIGPSATTSATLNSLSCGTSYNISVDAVDPSNNRSGLATIVAATDPCDTTPPTVQITSPAANTSITGAVTVSAGASDNKAVAGVQFKLNGNNLGAEDTVAPYSVTWDTTTGSVGNYTLTALARDNSNNQTASAAVPVTVYNNTPNFVNDTLIIGLSEPTNMVFAPDGRAFIIERGGRVWVAQPNALAVDPTPLLQLPTVWTADERGLLGIELDPNFTTNGYMYLYYTSSAASKNRISRFTVVGNTANLSTETVIWQHDVNAPIWHQGGDIKFGPDGKLYVAVGDHLDGASAQSLSSQSGKILRLNPDGSIPTDNPFYDGAGPNKDAIWLRGLRNPFRFSFDSGNGRMFIGDVGQGSWEEVNVGVRGANYGWPTCEGNCGTAGMTNPIYTYNHAGPDGAPVSASVTGGFVYRGNQFPAEYQGNYFFADYAQRWVKRIVLDSNGNFVSIQNFIPIDGRLGGPYGDIVALTMSPDGSIYYVDNGPFAAPNAGSVRRIKNTNANQPPTAQISANITGGPAPLSVNFSSAGSADPEGQPLTYSWDFGDGTTSAQANPSHTYNSNGRYTVRLTTSDGTNSSPSNTITITAGSAPHPTILTPSEGLKFKAGDTINFTGEATDPDDGPLASSNLTWRVIFHHGTHIHPALDSFTGTSGLFDIPTSGHLYDSTTWYQIVLTAIDSDGIQTQQSVNIYPDLVSLTFTTQPTGLSVSIDGLPAQTTPFTSETIKQFRHTISTDSPQFNSNGRYDFASWSSGAARSHQLIAPSTNQSYTATFNLTSTAPTGLVAAYSFNEGNGSTLFDTSGNNNNGTLTGPIWDGAGKNGGTLLFDGVNDFVSVPDSTSLDLTAGMTLEAWVKPTSHTGTGGWGTVLLKEIPGHLSYSLYSNTDSNRASVHVNVGGDRDTRSTTQLPLNTWTHLAGTFDGTTLRLYVNGAQVSTLAVSGSTATSNNPLKLGGNAIWGEWFTGLMDDVRVYNRALTATEIQNDMNIPVNLSW